MKSATSKPNASGRYQVRETKLKLRNEGKEGRNEIRFLSLCTRKVEEKKRSFFQKVLTHLLEASPEGQGIDDLISVLQQSSGSQLWVIQLFLGCNSQNSQPARLLVKASGNCGPRTPRLPKIGSHCNTKSHNPRIRELDGANKAAESNLLLSAGIHVDIYLTDGGLAFS